MAAVAVAAERGGVAEVLRAPPPAATATTAAAATAAAPWACARCTFINAPSHLACSMCAAERPAALREAAAGIGGPAGARGGGRLEDKLGVEIGARAEPGRPHGNGGPARREPGNGSRGRRRGREDGGRGDPPRTVACPANKEEIAQWRRQLSFAHTELHDLQVAVA